ncbi:DNA alkylation repair enzyme [Candidatus Izimaplasma bacterium HR1]|jgi:3-methyladenine DNA glycosylase AlkD/GNAT superfamily N-acetyltransferase|uniref:GNAT family N-acetyltransferase n=1 Tax=Candidatus Izimoplasma sp. HR1 TaxID=1541959 RepID=UPI0004F86386|nr:DNA alkylation repair enzyme [Candidatus Izimaplasma bacterium HR1]
MNKITYKKINYKHISDHFLNGYIRFQETTEVYYVEDNEMKLKNNNFLEDWDQEKLINVSRTLKDAVKNGGVLYAAYDQKQIIGFAVLDTKMFFDEYMNVPYIHSSKGYRGYGIGSYLFYLISQEAYKRGAKKLYISTHPAKESQMFYLARGCRITENINKELLALEPYDIQHEYLISPVSDTLKLIDIEYKTHYKMSAILVSKIASKLHRYLPNDEADFLNVCKILLMCDTRGYFSIGTLFLKRRTEVIKEENMEFFEDILFNYINEWDQVDQYCYRVLNYMIALKEEYYDYLLKWSDSENKDVRRASLVSMIKSSNKLVLEYDFDKMIFLVEKLKNDEDIHVRKAVGWVLKCSYFKYPERLEQYLRDNVRNLDRLIFRYALEHIEDPLREDLMNL